MIKGQPRIENEGFVLLCFDTNVYINLAKGNFPDLVQILSDRIAGGDCCLLTNDIIIEEWMRNKETTINSVKSSILSESRSAIKMATFITDPTEKKHFEEIIDKYRLDEKARLDKATELVEKVEDLLLKQSIKSTITNAMKLEAVELALEKKAPFLRKPNSVADALIVLSTVEYIKQTDIGAASTIFVSENFTEYGEAIRKGEKHTLHPDLRPLFDSVGLYYYTNVAEAMQLAQKFIDDYWAYLEQQAEDHFYMEWEIARGK
jgi:hypothetical protein